MKTSVVAAMLSRFYVWVNFVTRKMAYYKVDRISIFRTCELNAHANSSEIKMIAFLQICKNFDVLEIEFVHCSL